MTAIIYDKTEKGREEITTRKHHLAPRLRTLLVMIDGKQTADEIIKKVAGLGLTAENLQELLEQDFIAETASLTTTNTPGQEQDTSATGSEALSTGSALPEMSDAERFQALYNFFNETIKSAIGLRGYGLQLKVERAGNIDDFRALRQAYIDAILKAKGQEMARSLRDRLDQLLNDGRHTDEI